MQSSRFKCDDPNFYLLRGGISTTMIREWRYANEDMRTWCQLYQQDRNSMERGNASVFVESFARIQMDEDFGPRCRPKLATLNILLGSRASGESCFHERKKGCETELPAVAAWQNWGHLDREKFTLFANLTSVSGNIKSGEKYSRINLESINVRLEVSPIFARENSLL